MFTVVTYPTQPFALHSSKNNNNVKTAKQLLPFSFYLIAISWHADPRECCFVGDDLESKLFYYFAFLTLWSVSGSLIISPLHEASRIK